MNFRKFATLLLLTMLVIGFSKNSVLTAAEDSNDVSIAATQEAVTSNSAGRKSTTGKGYTGYELRLMSAIINCEAGDESYQGKLAVGIVIMNRRSSRSFPNTLKGVVYQKGQFSPVHNGTLKKRLAQYDAGKTGGKQWKECIKAARRVLSGDTTITYHGKTKNMKGFHFFSQRLPGARFRLGGHRFK